MKKTFEILLMVVLVLALQGCAAIQQAAPQLMQGDVIPIQTYSALKGMQMVVNEAPSTFAMAKDGLTLFAWPVAGCKGWAFVVLDTNVQDFIGQWKWLTDGKGNFTSGTTLETLVKGLTQDGWTKVAISSLAEGVVATIKGASLTSWMAARMTIPVFVLVGPAVPDPLKLVRPVQQ